MKRISRIVLLLLATALFIGGAYFSLRLIQQSRQQPVSAPVAAVKTAVVSAPTAPAQISGDPAHLSVPSVNISLDVMNGYYNAATQTWTSSITKAVYATVTAKPNNTSGGTFIYGHNRSSVFNRLLNAKIGDEAQVATSNGHVFTYKLADIHDTQPTDVSVLSYQGAPILTLQTCSGLFYQNRRMFVFNLEKVS